MPNLVETGTLEDVFNEWYHDVHEDNAHVKTVDKWYSTIIGKDNKVYDIYVWLVLRIRDAKIRYELRVPNKGTVVETGIIGENRILLPS